MTDAPSLLAFECGLPEPVRQTVARLRASRSPWGLTGDATAAITAVRLAAEDPELAAERERSRWWDQIEAWLAELAADETYCAVARSVVEAARARLCRIADGTVPYVADRAFDQQDVPVLELAVEVMMAADSQWTDRVLPALLVGTVRPPDPRARSVPSQAAYYALVRCVLARPTVALARAVRAAGAATRHAGVKKKTARLARDVDQALIRGADVGNVPDLGLGTDGTMVLDFGDKTFTVGFDERLRPTITDDQGKPRRSLPKVTTEPGASSVKVFAELKKDVCAVAEVQRRRLEEAMVTQRGWTLGEFSTYLMDHPLVWHLARRLVWRCDNGFFRVAEDRTFADVDDEVFVPVGTVRVAHQLNLGDQAHGWASLLADYEIPQPFPQVGRETYTADQITGFAGLVVFSGKVLSLERRGWRRAPVQSGRQWSVDRSLPDGNVWRLGLEPGLVVGEPMLFEEQTLHPADLTGLDPITCSEILRDLHTLQG